MGKLVPDSIIDLMLDQAEGTHVSVCSAEPANYAGIAAVTLAGPAALGGAYTPANGDVSGRKNTVPATSGISIGTTGDADHVVIHNNTDTMYLVTTCPLQSLTSGGTVDVAAFDHEITDAT